MTTKPPVDNEELWVMLMSTVRYALGRKDGLATDVVEYSVKFFPRLRRSERRQIIDEIDRALALANANAKPLGDDYSEQVWKGGLDRLRTLARDLEATEADKK
jgi:hypothetical protein